MANPIAEAIGEGLIRDCATGVISRFKHVCGVCGRYLCGDPLCTGEDGARHLAEEHAMQPETE